MRIIASVLTCLIFSCSGSDNGDNVISFWQFWSDMNTKPVVEKLAREFEQANPGIRIKITDLTWANGHDKLVISFAAKDPPDIMELGSDWIAEFSSNGLLAEFASDLPANYLEPAVWNGKLYALPWLLASRLIYFNLDLMEKSGTESPDDWERLLVACNEVDAMGDDVFGFGCNSAEKHRLYKKFLPFLWSNGGQVLNEGGNEALLDSKKAIEALDFYLQLCDCGIIESQRRLEEYFRDGKIGFVISGGWLLRRLRLNPPDFEYRLSPFFTRDGEPGYSFFGGEYLAVYSKSKNKEIAQKFARFLISSTNSQALCDAAGFGFPPYPDLKITDPEMAIEARQLVMARSTPATPLWNDIEMDIEDAIEAAMFGHGTAEEILIKTTDAINAKLKSAGHANKE